MNIAFCTRCVNESLFALAVLACASVVNQLPVFAAENEQVYLLQHASETQSPPYALTKLGAVAGAQKLQAPETSESTSLSSPAKAAYKPGGQP